MTCILNYFDDDEDEPNTIGYEAARQYHKLGWNVIPLVPSTKRASVKYAHWHAQRQSRAEVAMMRPLFDGGVAVITGAVSGIVVIDTDGPEGESVILEFEVQYGPLPETLIHRSGSGRGAHRFYRHPRDGRRIVTRTNPSIKLDIKGDGGIVVLPPTMHKCGGRYAVVREAAIAPLPADLIVFIARKAAEASGKPIYSTNAISDRSATALRDNLRYQVPLNRWNIGLVQSMLRALPDECADDENTWFQVGCALHSFDGGRVGLALWREFSERSPGKAAETNFDRKWCDIGRPFEGRKITVGTLRKMAVERGWKAKPWDWREARQ